MGGIWHIVFETWPSWYYFKDASLWLISVHVHGGKKVGMGGWSAYRQIGIICLWIAFQAKETQDCTDIAKYHLMPLVAFQKFHGKYSSQVSYLITWAVASDEKMPNLFQFWGFKI